MFSSFSEGMTSSQKKKKIEGKLLSAHDNLRKNLVSGYGFAVNDPPDISDSKTITANIHLNKIMKELKHSFSEINLTSTNCKY